MTSHQAILQWHRDGAVFTDGRYSRAHRWFFDGGIDVPASACPQVVPLPLSTEKAVDPEEAFVVSLASCHMLWFLFHAARLGFVVESYRDAAAGIMDKDGAGKMAITHVTLRPEVRFGGDHQPSPEQLLAMHEQSHAQCYLANSVKTEVRCEPVVASHANASVYPR